MPVFGPNFEIFERENNIRERIIKSKEKAAVRLAHSTLENNTEPGKLHKVASRIGVIITGRKDLPEYRKSVLAFYEPNDEASEAGREPSMAAYFTDVMGGVLFTRPVLEGEGPMEERLGVLQPRAIISKHGYYGYPVVALDEAGNAVFPGDLSLDARERFIDQVSETLTIISAQIHISQYEPQTSSTY